jgi:hypothetical protein
MVYHDFLKVNEIDTEIMTLHTKLAALYEERSKLFGAPNALHTEIGKSTQTTPQIKTATAVTEADALYELMKQNWAKYELTVPKYATLQKSLQKALLTLSQLSETKAYAEHLYVLLIPPKTLLQKAMSQPNAPKIQPKCVERYLTNTKKSWQVAIVFDNKLRVPIDSFHQFFESGQRYIQGFDALGLTVHAFVAAYLQGLVLADNNAWTCLLADRTSNVSAPCAQYFDDTMYITLDDSAGILGQNYFNPTILIG